MYLKKRGYVYFIDDGEATLQEYYGSMKSVVIPSTVQDEEGKECDIIAIGHTAFCKSNARVLRFDKNSKVFDFQDESFRNSSFVSIQIPDSLEYISQSVYFPKTLKYISISNNKYFSLVGNNILAEKFPLSIIFCPTYKKYTTIREGTKYVNNTAFRWNERMVSITIPSSLESIGVYSFDGCTNLKSLIFAPNSRLHEIGANAFSGTALTKFICPASIEYIGQEAFEGTKLKEIIFPEDSKLHTIESGAFISLYMKKLHFPGSIKLIQSKAFMKCKNLSSVIFDNPRNIEYISTSAFSQCNNITEQVPKNIITKWTIN